MLPVNPDDQAAYLKWLEEWASSHSDGCTKIPDIHVHCCWQHDFCYQTGLDPRSVWAGKPEAISRRDADALFRVCNQKEDPLGRFSPLSWWRWAAVRVFGRFFYSADKEKSNGSNEK